MSVVDFPKAYGDGGDDDRRYWYTYTFLYEVEKENYTMSSRYIGYKTDGLTMKCLKKAEEECARESSFCGKYLTAQLINLSFLGHMTEEDFRNGD